MTRWIRTGVGSGSRRLLVALIAVALVVSAGGGALARLQASLDAPSPAGDGASVVAQGVAAMPAERIAWRVVRDTAEPMEGAQPVERALGFAIAEPDGIQIVDSTAGSQERLAAGEAAFVPEGAAQIRASLTGRNAGYLRVAIVPEEQAGDAGDDTLVLGGDGFAAPDGQRDIDLVRAQLSAGASTTVAGSDLPVLVIATAGAIEVTAAGGKTSLEAGTAAQLTGDLTVTGGKSGGTFVAGVIGPEVPVPPRVSGTVTLGIVRCEPGIAEADFGDPYDPDLAARCTEDATDVETALITPDGEQLPLSDAEEVRPGVFTWAGLPFGTYGVASPTALPDAVVDRAVYDGDGNLVPEAETAIDADNPDAHLDLFLFQNSATGSIAITVYNCPEGMAPDSLDPAACVLATAGFDLSITNTRTGDITGIEDASGQGDAFVWADLPVDADYSIDQSQLPEGYAFWIAEGVTVPAGEGESYTVSLTADEPNATVTIYNLAQAAGTITLDTVVCPAADSAPGECTREFGPTGLGGIAITAVDGGTTLDATNATQEGDGPYVWPNLALGDYGIDAAALSAPDGYEIASVVLTPDGLDASTGFTLGEEVPIANIVVVLVPTNPPTPAEIDTDNDGLSDADEAAAGTDPANPDSDGDCHADGAEVAAGTNPLDGAEMPAGECDSVGD